MRRIFPALFGGLLSFAAAGASAGDGTIPAQGQRVVRLPPYIVSDSRAHIHWRYVSIPGYEFLSCCSVDETQKFAQGIFQQQRWLGQIVPPSLMPSNSVPTVFIVLNESAAKAMVDDIGVLTRQSVPTISQIDQDSSRVVPMPQIMLTDADSVSVDPIFHYVPNLILEFDPDYISYLLLNRAPRFPAWFCVGVLQLYGDLAAADQGGLNNSAFFTGGDRLSFTPARYERGAPGARESLIPMSEFLAGPQPEVGQANPVQLALWRFQAGLFVRWALADESGVRRQGFWRLTALASDAPLTDATVQSCFGMGFRQLDRALAAYLPNALEDTLNLRAQFSGDVPWIEPRDPTEAEKARILGDWQRKEVEYIRNSSAFYAEKYADQAGRTFQLAYDDGIQDPDLLAAFGLFECTVGNDARAGAFLERAVAAEAGRPRAYVELARIRLDALLAKPSGPNRKLDRTQLSSITGLVEAAQALIPPQFEGFIIAATALERADFPLAPSDLRLLREGIALFPDQPALIIPTAQLEAVSGFRNEAVATLDQGLARVSNPKARNLMATLRQQYVSAAPPAQVKALEP